MRCLCGLFGRSKQAFYKHDDDALLSRAARSEFVVDYVLTIRRKDPGIGGLKLWHMYKKAFSGNAPVGRDAFMTILSDNGLKVRDKPRRPKTTDSAHGLPVYPNLVKEYIPDAPDRLWVSDITYVTVWPEKDRYAFCYLSMVMDAYTEEIIGWSVRETLGVSGPLEALRMALGHRGIQGRGLIHHSDRGCQYASREYVSELRRHGISISMTECGDPKENAQAERVNGTMKNELLKGMVFRDIAQARSAIGRAVEFYNKERPNMSIDMMTPSEASARTGEIKKRWTSYRLAAIKSKQEGLIVPENSLPLQQSRPAAGIPAAQ